MSREGSLCRAREQARLAEEAIAKGAGLYLLGCPIVVLYNEPTRAADDWLATQLADAAGAAANEAVAP